MLRRNFLKLSGAAAAATTATVGASLGANTGELEIALTIAPANVEMIDGTQVYSLLFFENNATPRPVLRAREGQIVAVQVTNSDVRVHGFAIPGIPAATIAPIPPGQTASVRFAAPPGGSFLYLDPVNAPTNRLLGLHGAFIVAPVDGATPDGAATPYSANALTRQVAAVFDAMGGGNARFPGEKWNPADPDRERIWLFNQVDPALNAQAAKGVDVPGDSVKASFLPRYFTINGLSGFDTAVHNTQTRHSGGDAVMPSGREGQPCLIRTMNVGLATHSPHIHGNHVMILATNDPSGQNSCGSFVMERDAWTLRPLACVDVLLPFERPPDIPLAAWPPREEPFPLRYVMHCHNEISQTAAGGNYPMGAVTHWEMTGPHKGGWF